MSPGPLSGVSGATDAQGSSSPGPGVGGARAGAEPLLKQVEGWLRLHLSSLGGRVDLGIFCAGQGVRLDQLASPLLSLEDTASRLVDHLVGHLVGHLAGHPQKGALLRFAAALLYDETLGPAGRERGLFILLDGDGSEAGKGALTGALPRVRPPLFNQRLLRADAFAGRDKELSTLDWAWQEGARVMALTGPPGSGKTALLTHWLEGRGLSDPRRWKDFGVEGLFVWSFAANPDVASFLRAAADYVEGRSLSVEVLSMPSSESRKSSTSLRLLTEDSVRRADLLRLLRALDRTAGHILLILDGLERFQLMPSAEGALPSDRERESPGEIIEPLLRALLCEMSAVDGEAALLCTLDREVPSLLPWRGSGYMPVVVPPLAANDGARLLRLVGVTRGTEADAEQRSSEHQGHALTLDLLGRYLSAYYRGDARAVTGWELPPKDETVRLPEAPTLGRMLKAHVQALTDPLRGLLEICVLLPGQTSLSALSALSQVAREHPPQGGPLAVETVLAPLRGLDAGNLRQRLSDLSRLGLLQLAAPPEGDREALVVDVHPLLRRILYRSWLDARGGRAMVPVGPAAAAEGIDTLPRPQDGAVLDLLEQLVLVALEAGLLGEAYELLSTRMGGYPHLGRNLGEYRRLLGILRILSPVLSTVADGDPVWSRRCARVIAWEAETLMDLGQLDAALAIAQEEEKDIGQPVPGALSWQVEIHLRAGRLRQAAEMAARASHASQSVAARVLCAVQQARAFLLLGETSLSKIFLMEADLLLREQPAATCEWDGLPLRDLVDRERVQVLLRLSAAGPARQLLLRCQASALRDGRGKDLAYLDILFGETARREQDPLDAAQAVHRALTWGSRTGDAEVMVQAGLCHARIRMDAGNLDGAASALGMALPTAEEMGLAIDRVDLLLSRGHLLLRRGDVTAAESDARDALAQATAPGCGYLWGEADGLHLLALSLLAGRPPGRRLAEAASHLTDEVELRDRMLDPRAQDVRWLLSRLSG